MTHFLNRGPTIRIPDFHHPGWFQEFPNSEWDGIPNIISFTDFLKWNYTVDYGRYIRELHQYGCLPISYEVTPKSEILDVEILDGKYDRIDETSFFMYVIVGVTFQTKGEKSYQQYCVTGHCDICGISNFLTGIELYHGEYIRRSSPLDEFLVPILSRKKFDEEAKRMLEKYYPLALTKPVAITGIELAESMGYRVQYERLSLNGKIKAKLIFDRKSVTVYSKLGEAVVKEIPKRTILVDRDAEGNKANAIVHECVHAYEHRLFYELQTYYHRIVGRTEPDFQEYFYSYAQEESLRWMEIQADAITGHIRMPSETTADAILDYFDQLPDIPNFADYRELIDYIKWKFQVSRYAAKKRIIELGWWEIRGVYDYLITDYVEDYMVESDLPADHTYTIQLKDLSEIAAALPEFAALIRSGKYVYADGHLCRNTPQYIKKDGGIRCLTETAKFHMWDCCIRFKKVYEKQSYSYTYGELNKEALSIIEKCEIDEEVKRQIKASFLEVNANYNALKQRKTNSVLGEAIAFHMKRCNVTNEQLMERTCLGSTTITKLRNGNCHPKLETILAFCIGLELEAAARNDVMQKADVHFDSRKPTHRMYLTILDLCPGINVFQFNNLLIEEGFQPLTKEAKEHRKMAI